MDKKTFGIGVLFLTAVVLFVGNMVAPTPSVGQQVIKDRDYQLATVPDAAGGDTLYVTDNRTGMVAVFAYDGAARAVKPRVVRPVSDAFPH